MSAAARRLPDVPEGGRLIGAAPLIPEVMSIGESQGVDVATHRHEAGWSQYQLAEAVHSVHHVEERNARILPRGWQQRKERAVRRVIRIAVSRSVVQASADPWRKDRVGLPSGLRGEGAGAMRELAPRAELYRPPDEHVERPVLSGDGRR